MIEAPPTQHVATHAPEQCDTVTVLRAPGLRLVKLIPPEGEAISYDSAKHFQGRSVRVNGIPSLRALLDRLISRPDCCVVRGELIAPSPVARMRRLVYADPETGDAPTLRDVPRQWLALDFDNVPLPPEIQATDLLGCADVAIDTLPRAFWQATCIVQATAQHGIKPGIRLRTWHWCDRAITGAEVKRWLGKLTDSSVLNPCQPIYTGRPIFSGGRADHLPERLVEWPGENWLRCPSPEELAPPPPPRPEKMQPIRVAGAARTRLYVEAALDKARTRIANAALRHPAILSEACALARFVHAGMLTRSELHSALWDGAKCAGKNDEAEITRMVDFGLQHPSTNQMPEYFRHG